ncbi:DUF2690 domain-containing protein [Lentzea sp. NPDC006480]|uniref:DUF2690 domain-containing protein n=1 Tax=Lentzea sp. NPDC006480 TaxID=3157176 RepID=UPI0033A2FBAC
MGNKLLTRTAAAIGLSVAMIGGFATAASAVTCSGAGCDRQDPYDTGCGASRVVSGTKTSAKGTFRLYYSTTCKTNWIEVANYAGGSTATDGKLSLTAWDRARNEFAFFHTSPTPGRHYGNMIYSPRDSCGIGYAFWAPDPYTPEVRIASSGC